MRSSTSGSTNQGNRSRIPTKEKQSRSSISQGGRLSNTGARLSGISRPKTSFGASSRKSSQYGRESYMQIKETRPLSDKSYQHQEIQDILQFLSVNDYQHPISMKTMTIPTSKEFLKVFSFLYSHISPKENYTKLKQKPDEEVPRILKTLGYPFTIHKTLLSNVGSPHTWPVLLGALHWLMELVKLAQNVNDTMDECLFPMNDEDKLYFDYLEKAYEAFIYGQDLDNLDEYTEALYEELRNKNAPLIAENEELSHENKLLEEELARLESEPSKLEALVEQKRTLCLDKTKFETYITDLEKHRLKLEERKIQNKQKLNDLNLEYTATSREKEQLEKVLAKQELSAADVQRMKYKADEQRRILQKLHERRDTLDENIWATEMNYARRYEQVLEKVEHYNEKCRQVKLIPSSAENACGNDYELQLSGGRLSLDVRGHLTIKLFRVKQQFTQETFRYDADTLKLKEKLDLVQEQISEKQYDIQCSNDKTATVEKELAWNIQQYDEELKILSDGIEDQRNLIDRLRLDNQTEMSGKRKKLEDAKERLKSTEVELKREEESLKSFLRNGCERVLKHKTIIENRVKEVQKNTKEWSVKMRSAIPEVSCVLSKEEIDIYFRS
ncbi:kinetochore protein NDC80 homolog isoform X1 [Xenia sp. Carnegie-2017]|uniref:kinetochore protein NDC80 homolog isoform X1 n=1 Tax=Xenia sp. Carnegie-2017 TaxID=2897299 RepID=UPI001F03B5B2|nr:kinetochore protein NDC80 homolog isoform X1 [Xenia sp. Carnegie-2017]